MTCWWLTTAVASMGLHLSSTGRTGLAAHVHKGLVCAFRSSPASGLAYACRLDQTLWAMCPHAGRRRCQRMQGS